MKHLQHLIPAFYMERQQWGNSLRGVQKTNWRACGVHTLQNDVFSSRSKQIGHPVHIFNNILRTKDARSLPRLLAWQWETQEQRVFCIFIAFGSTLGPTQLSLQWGRAFCPRPKRLEREGDQSTLPSTDILPPPYVKCYSWGVKNWERYERMFEV